MPHVLETPAPDPALVSLFKGSRKSYAENVDALIAKLDEAAVHTRAAREKKPEATSPARKSAAVSVVRKASPAPAKTSRKAEASSQ